LSRGPRPWPTPSRSSSSSRTARWADGIAEVDDGDIAPGFERHGFDPELDSVLVLDEGHLVGWAEFYRGRAEVDVRPSHTNRGIGGWLLTWTEARARALGGPDVGQTKTDGNRDAKRLFLANGYAPEWTAWIIRTELDEPPAPAVIPEGISIRPYEPSDARAVHELIDAAFSEWPSRNPEPFDVWARVIAHPWFAPELHRSRSMAASSWAPCCPTTTRAKGGVDPATRHEGDPPSPWDRAGVAADGVRVVLRAR